MIDFDSVQSTLQKLKADIDAAEAHGILFGLLLGGQDFSKWVKYVVDNVPDRNDLLAKEQMQLLLQLHDLAKEQLYSEDMSIEMLLPDEAEDFSVRLLGLANWCQGFLYGLALNGEKLVTGLSDEGKECLNDLVEISQLRHDEEHTDEAEIEYEEVAGHVRLSVIFMNEELNPVQGTAHIH